MEIGNRIKKRRLELGLSVDDVAKKIKKNRATIYRYENGEIENVPSLILEQLASVLDTTPVELMGYHSDDVFLDGCKITEEEKEVIRHYRCNPQMQPAVNTLLGINSDNYFDDLPIAARSGVLEIAKPSHSKEERDSALNSEIPGVSTPVKPKKFWYREYVPILPIILQWHNSTIHG